jgi:hypothetical protein
MLDLTEVVLRALDLHSSYELPTLDPAAKGKRIVIASGNALPTGRILYSDQDVVFANESQYPGVLEKHPEIAEATVISASGSKDSPREIRYLLKKGIETTLMTCVGDSEAAQLLPSDAVVVTRALEEPITYNTSTYLGMILAKTREDPAAIKDYILSRVSPLIHDLSDYKAFFLLVHPDFEVEREMLITKFDELFGGRLIGRCYTPEETLHAKTLVPWKEELFISFGFENEYFGDSRLTIPLPPGASFGAMMCVAYYVIGHIQTEFPPWFKENAEAYKELQRSLYEIFRNPTLDQT